MTQMSDATATTSAAAWSLARRIGFRFGFLVGALLLFPFPLSAIPRADWLNDLLTKPWYWGVSWFAQRVLGLADPPAEINGSGDTTCAYLQVLLLVLLAALGATPW